MQTMFITTAVVFFLTTLSASLTLHHKSFSQAVIVNGTSVDIGYMEQAFLFCKAKVMTVDNLHEYQVQWRNSTGDPVDRWSNNNCYIYSLGTGTHVPHSYLVLQYFSSTYAGDYTCVLLHENYQVDAATIKVL